MRKLVISVMASMLSVCALAQAGGYDVVVYGGTASGVITAYTAAKEGLSVALLERTGHVGGLTTSGIGNVDIGWPTTVGGYTAEFLRTVGAHYGTPHKMQIHLECKVAEQIMNRMLAETGVHTVFHTRLQERNGVEVIDGKIAAVTMEDGSVYRAAVFVDCSYEGDLMAQAGVSYLTGREGRDEFGESSAGVCEYRHFRNYTPEELPAVRKIAAKYPLDIKFEEKVAVGTADSKSQAYVYRLTVTDDPDNRVPFYKPEGYDPDRYFNVLYRIQRRGARRFGQILTLYPLPNKKYDLNHMDLINGAWDYPEGSYALREAIDLYHRRYQEGYLYFLANDPRVPEELRKDVQRYGYAKDEYADNGNWPYQLYIREGRRMRGEYIMRQQDAWENPTKEDAVAIGSYFLDCHFVSSVVTKHGFHMEEGAFEYTPYRPYEIAYRAITPKKSECANLLVPVCMSATHVICASLRMEPVYMMLGQVAGNAAAMAIKGGTAVQDIDVKTLQKTLRAQKQIIHFKTPLGMYLEAGMFDGTVVDDSELGLNEGFWSHSTSQGPFMKYNYRFAPVRPDGGIEAVFPIKVDSKGRYEVQIMYAASGNRVRNADVTVVDKKGKHPCEVDMTQSPRIEGSWHSLGVYSFDPKSTGKVVFTNKGESGVVVVDAIRFIKK